MNKKVSNYFAIPLAICSALFMALKPSPNLDVEMYSTDGLELNYTVKHDLAFNSDSSEHQLANPFQTQHTYFPYLGKSYNGFKEAIAFKESRGDYFTVNTLGYLGKYQFGAETLKMIGIYNPNQFLYNPELQEKAFLANAERNKWILRKDIQRFTGKKINGIIVTESGILAAAHLAGPGSVKKFLRSYGSNNFSDAYGTTVKHYMKKFSGYDTSSILPDKRAKAVL
ncbi:peptidoglycan-binding protein LysM [uncultured Psychroserpens sp.]|uniref:peptidoglycan-binding protein LysM n=1 Tax=uncultured Psychroserpens sp. TaxID=255436 RepID=UPI0026210E34|nr:peptidoglycan-binding protein LysM [uncultured Psychroserpens sp.]